VAASNAGVSASWPYSNGDLANTRDATGSTVSSANVPRLAPAWTLKLTGKAAAGLLNEIEGEQLAESSGGGV
jgi:hypothetical protein